MSAIASISSLQDAATHIEQLLLAYTGEDDTVESTSYDGLSVNSTSDRDTQTTNGDASKDNFSTRLEILTQQFNLTPIEVDALLLAISPDLRSYFSQAFTRIHGTTSLRRPTIDVICDILEASGQDTIDAYSVFSPSSPLIRWQLLDVRSREQSVPFHARVVSPEQRILAYLLGDDEPTGEFASFLTVSSSDEQLGQLPITEQTRTKLTSLPAETDTIYYFVGSDESVRRRAVDAVCQVSEQPVLRTTAGTLGNNPSLFDTVLREGLLQQAPIHLSHVEALVHTNSDSQDTTTSDMFQVIETLDSYPGDVYLTGERKWVPDRDIPNHDFRLVEFPDPGYELRKELWAQRASELPDTVTPTDLAGTFELTQGQIDSALVTARAISSTHAEDDRGMTKEHIYQGCKAQSSANLSALAEPITPDYTWDDILLPDDTEKHLRAVATHITNRGTVYSEWGFESKFSRGIGVVALFSGPSGTGKTMAAQVLANDAGLELYRIDLSTVVSKYIGETEENLEQIFDEAEQSSAILLFDEADAIFGERSEVSDSTDRYANAEVNYLLQRIEQYDGVVLLTTNYESNIDSAFRRRIHLHVEFTRPGEEIREQLWQNIFPKETPTEELDYDFLSTIELSGGEIRNAAQTAAFRAASEDSPVGMRHVVSAVRREREKTGVLIDPSDFGEYREFLTY